MLPFYAGIFRFRGSIHARCSLSSRSTLSHALAMLRGDVVQTLQDRLRLHIEDREDNDPLGFHVPSQGESEECSLPRRILFPLVDGGYLCDYILPDEVLDDGAKDRVDEMTGLGKCLGEAIEVEQNVSNLSASTSSTQSSSAVSSSSSPAFSSSSTSLPPESITSTPHSATQTASKSSGANPALLVGVGVVVLAVVAFYLIQ